MTKKNYFQIFVISLFLLGGMASAKRAPDPVIQFSEAFEDKLVGTIETVVEYSQVSQRQFFLVDQNGQIVWEFLQQEGVQALEFSFEMPPSVMGGLYDFHIIWLDEYQQQIVSAQALVENIRDESESVFEVLVNRTGPIKVRWQAAENTNANAKLLFQLRENSYWGPVIFQTETTAQSAQEGEIIDFETEFVLPKEPESYLALVQVVDASGRLLSPKYQQRFLVPGDFAEITGVLPVSGSDLGSALDFNFSGSVMVPDQEGLVLKIKEPSGLFEEMIPLDKANRNGSVAFEKKLSVPSSADTEFIIDVLVENKDGTVLESKQYTYKKTAPPPVPVVEAAEPEFKIPFWAYAFGGFGLVAIGILFWWMKRKQRPVV